MTLNMMTPNPLSKHFNPIHTTLAAAIEASKARHVKMWRENKSCRWVEAVDDASGEVVGGACWMFNLLKEETKELEKKRDEGGGSGEGVDANWHVEGSEEKRFAERLIEGMRGFVGGKVGGVPHLGSFFLFSNSHQIPRPSLFLRLLHTTLPPSLQNSARS